MNERNVFVRRESWGAPGGVLLRLGYSDVCDGPGGAEAAGSEVEAVGYVDDDVVVVVAAAAVVAADLDGGRSLLRTESRASGQILGGLLPGGRVYPIHSIEKS
jgi:hypothetical protein